MHTEAHISEILDSDDDSNHEISSEEERLPKNIWNNAEFWAKNTKAIPIAIKLGEEKKKLQFDV
jgi:hypothetical protein